MRWPIILTRLAYGLVLVGLIGLCVGAVEGVRAAIFKCNSTHATLPHDREPTKEELLEYRQARSIEATPYKTARSHADVGLLVAFISLLLGIPLGIYAEKRVNKKIMQN
jgi:hypothetical protein